MNGTLRKLVRWSPSLLPLLLLAAIGSHAAVDPTRDIRLPPTPKFKPPAEGVLFATDFSDGMRGWVSEDEEYWSVRNGSLRGDLPDQKQVHSLIFAGSQSWTDYVVDVDVLGVRGVDKGLAVRVEGETGIGVDLRGPGYHDVLLHRRESKLAEADVQNGNGMWHHIKVEARGHRYRVWIDGTLLIDKEDVRQSRPRGRIALAAYTGGSGQCTVYYDNVIVTEIPASSRESGGKTSAKANGGR